MKFVGTISYWIGRLRGSVQGTNSPEMAREAILDDIGRAKQDIRVASCTLDLSYWDESVVLALRKKLSVNPSLKAEFLVGPKLNNPPLENLAKEGKIALLHLKNKPPCDCRIIDKCDTYTSNHADASGPRRYCWTFANIPAIKDRLAYYNSLKRLSA